MRGGGCSLGLRRKKGRERFSTNRQLVRRLSGTALPASRRRARASREGRRTAARLPARMRYSGLAVSEGSGKCVLPDARDSGVKQVFTRNTCHPRDAIPNQVTSK